MQEEVSRPVHDLERPVGSWPRAPRRGPGEQGVRRPLEHRDAERRRIGRSPSRGQDGVVIHHPSRAVTGRVARPERGLRRRHRHHHADPRPAGPERGRRTTPAGTSLRRPHHERGQPRPARRKREQQLVQPESELLAARGAAAAPCRRRWRSAPRAREQGGAGECEGTAGRPAEHREPRESERRRHRGHVARPIGHRAIPARGPVRTPDAGPRRGDEPDGASLGLVVGEGDVVGELSPPWQ